jgi:hypothetical protein
MRDIRQDLRERLDALEAQRRHLQEQMAVIDNQSQLLASLLIEEKDRWEEVGDVPPKAVREYKPSQNGSVAHERLDLTQIIQELLDCGEPWFTSQLASIAKKRGYDFGTRQPGRSVHFTLIAMARRGDVENAGLGRWRKKQQLQRAAS